MNSRDTRAVAPSDDSKHKGFTLEEIVDGGPLRVTFSAVDNPFILKKLVCSNPECDFYHLSFRELSDENDGGEPMTFGICVDLRQLVDRKARDDMKVAAIRDGAPQALVEEFLENFPEERRSRWLEDFKYSREAVNRLQSYRFDPETLLSGGLVSHTDIYTDNDNFFHGGGRAFISFLYKGASFFVDDLYCPNPLCKCHNAVLVVAEIVHGENDQPSHLVTRFSVKVSLDGKISKFNCFDYSEKEARQCLAQLQSETPDLLDQLKDHYDTVKEIGERSLEEARGIRRVRSKGVPVRKNKIGRNALCECGSGKKYKKCCGA